MENICSFLNSLTAAADHPFILDIVFLVNPSSFVWESVVLVLSRRWRRNCHEKACPWQRKAKSLSEKNYCSLSWVTLRGHKRLVLFFF